MPAAGTPAGPTTGSPPGSAGRDPLEAGPAARARAERRAGIAIAAAGLVGAIAGMALAVRDGLRGHDYPLVQTLAVFAAGLAVYGAGMYRAQWPPSRPAGVPPLIRHALTLLVCLGTWFVLATASGLIAAVLKERALTGR